MLKSIENGNFGVTFSKFKVKKKKNQLTNEILVKSILNILTFKTYFGEKNRTFCLPKSLYGSEILKFYLFVPYLAL